MAQTAAQAALQSWVKSLPTVILQCRTGRHDMPTLDKAHVTRPRELRGQFLAEQLCGRGCGTFIRKIYDRHGYIRSSYRGRYDYTDPEYRAPNEVLDAIAEGEMSWRDVNAAMRLELIRRGGAA